MATNYINDETLDMFDYVSDGARQRDRYILRPLTKDYIEQIKNEIPMTIMSSGFLDEINPVLPREFINTNEQVAFMKLQNQKYGDLGFVMLGQFHNDDLKPDSIQIYLGRKSKNERGENTIRIWKDIRNTPGFEDIYKFGNTFKTQKSVIVSGRNGDNRGTISTSTNQYDILSGLRVFLSKAEIPNSQANKLIKAIYDNDYRYLDTRAIYKKADTFTTKLNDLVSGKLENVIFTRSQVRDTDFAHTKSNMGDPYYVTSKLDMDVFDLSSKGIKTGSVKNRIEFSRFLEVKKGEILSKSNDVKSDYNLKKLKDIFIEYNKTKFSQNLNTFGQLKEYLKDETENIYSLNNSWYDKNGISGKFIMDLIDKNFKKYKSDVAEDYFNKREILRKKLYDIIGDRKDNINFNDFKFNKHKLYSLVKKIDEDFKPHQQLLTKKMEGIIGSKADYVFNKSYKDYLSKINNRSNTYVKTMDIIERDAIREFYDRYNEKTDLIEMMTASRRDSLVSEKEIIASMVEINKDKNGNIKGVKIHDKPFFGLNKLEDVDFKYKYYKTKRHLGRAFDKLSLEKKLNLVSKYGMSKDENYNYRMSDGYKNLVKRHEEKISLGKYDTYENFKKSNSDTKYSEYEMVASDVLSRTTDKIISKFNLEDKSMSIQGSIFNDNTFVRLNVKLKKDDGFDKNNFVKEHLSEKQSAFKLMDLKTQKLIEKNDELYYKNYNMQKIIDRIRRTLPDDANYSKEYDKLNQFASFLKGGVAKKDKKSKLAFTEDGFLTVVNNDKDFRERNLTKITDYNVAYDQMFLELNMKYGNKIGYLLSKSKREKDEDMKSTTELLGELLVRTRGKLNNATYMAIINHDQITNYSGSSKQQSLIRGNMYYGNPGIAQPGLTWNKYSQRTYQAQDLLGEQYITTGDNQDVTVSQIHANILKHLGGSGVGQRTGRYTTEELYKKAINDINERKGIGDAKYFRGEVYKTFAIGDVNSGTDNLYNYSASFQEGMTASKSMILTTNSIRSKTFNINLDELDFNKLNMTKEEINEQLKTESGFDVILSKILEKDLYRTLKGRDEYARKLEELNNMNLLRRIQDGNLEDLKNYYSYVVSKVGGVEKTFDLNVKNKNKVKEDIISEIYSKLETLKTDLGVVALPTTPKGKVVITNENVKTNNELKPELGFSLREAIYNEQTKNIELHLENFGVNTQGSKGQSTGAKFTISEIYDFLKIKNGNKDIYVDAIFNNKAEKRTQTGIILHTLLQTVYSNIYETSGIKGVAKLRENMKEMLEDFHTDIKINGDYYEIDEAYLTRSFKDKNEIMSIDEFQEIMKEPLDNTVKRFTEEGKEILDKVIKKYGTQIVKDGKSSNQGAHFGLVQAMQKSYSQTYRDLGQVVDEIPIAVYNADVTGISDHTPTNFGKGTFLLLKLASERVNSTASKKKESALKVSREMLGMLKGNGYNQLTDYMEERNKNRLSNKLEEVFNNISNAELLNKIYSHKPNFNLYEVNIALSETLENSVLFDLDTLTKNDYLVQSKDGYPLEHKFIELSSLGRAMKDKELDTIEDGELKNSVNVVINDTGINSFTQKLKQSISNVSNYYYTIANEDGPRKKSYQKVYNTLESLRNIDENSYKYSGIDKEIKKAINEITYLANSKDKSYKQYADTYDLMSTLGFLKMVNKNAGNSYSLEQLKTVMNTGNMLTTVNLNYSVDEVDGSIVSSESFRRIENIARKNFEFKSSEKTLLDIRKKIVEEDRTILDAAIKDITGYISGNKPLEETSVFIDLFKNLDFSKSSNEKTLSDIRNKMFDIMNNEYRAYLEKDSLNKFLSENVDVLGMDSKEVKERVELSNIRIEKLFNEISESKKELNTLYSNSNITGEIKDIIDDSIFGNKKLANDKTFDEFYADKISDSLFSGFELLDEYIKAPATSDSLFKKKSGLITSNQKFKIKTSLVANPLEGSNLINKFSHLMFDNLKDAKQLQERFSELQEFIGADYVNEKLFEDSDGTNIFNELINRTNKGSFEEGVEKAKQLFNVNMSEISEVTITDKRYTKAFRNKDFEWKDIYNGTGFKDDNSEGFVRELSFLSRHPQQTINHMGAVMNITVDSESDKLKNRFARATLTYLPKETNNAGVITLGKKTMLLRKGDHDGDKIQLAFLDFIENEFTKSKTKEQMYLDFQLKNNTFGEWDIVKGKFNKLTGNILVDDNLVELNKLSKKDALELIEQQLGLNEEQLNMRTKIYNTYLHAVGSRAKKELNKHYNEIYDIMGAMQYLSVNSGEIKSNDIKKVKNVMELYRGEVNSHIAHKGIRETVDFLDSLSSGKANFKVEINDLNLVGATALYKIIQGNKDNTEDLYKAVKKDIDKFISRGNFDEFYKSENSKAIFDELSGIRNTGLTHSYATQIRMASIELKELNPSDFLDKIAEFSTSDMSIDTLNEMVRKQSYYYGNTDLLVDNMIESAISAKHGLTLGGLEGSKIFINTLLSNDSESMNNKIIKMYDDIYINNSFAKKVNLLENIASYKKSFDERNQVLEDITNKVVDAGLDKNVFYKLFDLGEKGFEYRLSKLIDKDSMDKYISFGREYNQEVNRIEIEMMDNLIEEKYLNVDEFEIYKGLNLFGELLIQNDPGLEFDSEEVLSAIKDYRDNKITKEQLMSNKEVFNLENQAFTSLGSAASISNIGNLRNYLSGFVAKNKYDDLYKSFKSQMLELDFINDKLKETDFERMFNKDFTIKENYSKNFTDEQINKIEIKSGYFNQMYSGLRYQFENKINSSNNPMQVFSQILNPNNTLFSEVGKDGNESIKIIKELRDNGVRGVNESSLSKSLERIDQSQNRFLNQFINNYREYDRDFDAFSAQEVLDDLVDTYYDEFSDSMVSRLDNAINDAVFNKYKKEIKDKLRIGDDSMTHLRITNVLNRTDRKLLNSGKLQYIKLTDEFDIGNIFGSLLDSKKYILDDISFLYDKKTGKFDREKYQKLIERAEGSNLYFSERLAKRRFLRDNKLRNQYLTNHQRKKLGKELLLAKKYLGEDFTVNNINRRLNFKFDSKLASVASVEEYFKNNKDIKNNSAEYRKKVSNVLSKILEDFKSSDSRISTDYINDKYIKYAMRFVDKNETYNRIRANSQKELEKIGRTREIITKFFKYDKDKLETVKDKDLLMFDLQSQLMNNVISSTDDIKYIIKNSMKEMEDISINNFKTRFSKKLIDGYKPNKLNKKLGITTTASIIGMGLYKLVTPYFSKGDGVYTLSNNVNGFTEKEIAEKLSDDITNNNEYMKSLRKNPKIANYVINKDKNF